MSPTKPPDPHTVIRELLDQHKWELLQDWAGDLEGPLDADILASFLALHGRRARADAEALVEALAGHPLTHAYPTERKSNMDFEFTAGMAKRGTPDDLDDQLRAHAEFLVGLDEATHGPPGQGRWQIFEVAGMPLAMFEWPRIEAGKQLELRLTSLAGRSLRGLDLRFSSLAGIDAVAADFSGAQLYGSVMTDSVLERVDFRGADLRTVDFSRSRLIGACFVDADLRGADLENCDLTDADFTGAKLGNTRFAGAIRAPR